MLFYKGKVFDFIIQGEKENQLAKDKVKEPANAEEVKDAAEDDEEDGDTKLSHNQILERFDQVCST